jgi:hypothetical protein
LKALHSSPFWARLLAGSLATLISGGTLLAAEVGPDRLRKVTPITKPVGPAPRFADGQIDLSGVLFGGGDITARALKPGDSIVLLPEAKKIQAARKASEDPVSNCLPAGVPRIGPLPWRIVQAMGGKYIFILFEGNIHSYRQIFMDGRKHPPADEIDPRWYGHSIGHWEGDTLVVDTVGFNDKFWFGQSAIPHTEQLHIVERFRRENAATLRWDITVEDPGAFAKPFTVNSRGAYRENTELMEFFCQENETSASGGHIIGGANSATGTNTPFESKE